MGTRDVFHGTHLSDRSTSWETLQRMSSFVGMAHRSSRLSLATVSEEPLGTASMTLCWWLITPWDEG